MEAQHSATRAVLMGSTATLPTKFVSPVLMTVSIAISEATA